MSPLTDAGTAAVEAVRAFARTTPQPHPQLVVADYRPVVVDLSAIAGLMQTAMVHLSSRAADSYAAAAQDGIVDAGVSDDIRSRLARMSSIAGKTAIPADRAHDLIRRDIRLMSGNGNLAAIPNMSQNTVGQASRRAVEAIGDFVQATKRARVSPRLDVLQGMEAAVEYLVRIAALLDSRDGAMKHPYLPKRIDTAYTDAKMGRRAGPVASAVRSYGNRMRLTARALSGIRADLHDINTRAAETLKKVS